MTGDRDGAQQSEGRHGRRAEPQRLTGASGQRKAVLLSLFQACISPAVTVVVELCVILTMQGGYEKTKKAKRERARERQRETETVVDEGADDDVDDDEAGHDDDNDDQTD